MGCLVGLVALAGEVLIGHPAFVPIAITLSGDSLDVSPSTTAISVDNTAKDNCVRRLKSSDLVPVQGRPIPNVQAITLDEAPGLVDILRLVRWHDSIGCGSPQQEESGTSESILHVLHGILQS
jgi:hypothetical protein